LATFLPKICNCAIVEEIVGDDIVPEVFIERIRTYGGDMTLGDGKVDGDIGSAEHFVTLTETYNLAQSLRHFLISLYHVLYEWNSPTISRKIKINAGCIEKIREFFDEI
jgi:hypothetical protein